MESDLEPWLIFALATLLVGFATVVEVAFSSVQRGDIRKLSERGERRAQFVDKLLTTPVQFGMTVLLLKSAGLVLAGGVTVQGLSSATGYWQWGAMAVAWLVLVLAQAVCRTLASRHGTTLALQLLPFIQVLVQIFWPLTILLRTISAWIGGQEVEKNELDGLWDGDDLHQLISSSEEENTIEAREKEMIVSILEMDETVVREVMVPRIDMVAIDVETSLREALRVIMEAGHSRIPVYREHVDQIIGILYAKDLLKCFYDDRADAPIRELLRPAYFVPVSKKVNTLLKEMQKERVHIAVVVDEYGGTAGLVTIEDLIEEIVGEIQDEYDNEAEVFVEAIGANVYVLNSRLDLYSLCKLLDIELPDEDSDTLGGLIYSLLGHVPEQGEAVECAGWRFTVLSLDGQRIDQVRAEPIAAQNPESFGVNGTEEQSGVHPAPGANSLYDFQSSD